MIYILVSVDLQFLENPLYRNKKQKKCADKNQVDKIK